MKRKYEISAKRYHQRCHRHRHTIEMSNKNGKWCFTHSQCNCRVLDCAQCSRILCVCVWQKSQNWKYSHTSHTHVRDQMCAHYEVLKIESSLSYTRNGRRSMLMPKRNEKRLPTIVSSPKYLCVNVNGSELLGLLIVRRLSLPLCENWKVYRFLHPFYECWSLYTTRMLPIRVNANVKRLKSTQTRGAR